MDIISIISVPFLVCAALLPAIALCIFIYIKDRAEKEPIGLLFALFGLGIAIIPPVIVFELLLGEINTVLFSFGGEYAEGSLTHYIYIIVDNFMCVALIEEIFKWIIVYLFAKFNKNFNSLFDGIIYSVFVSLGFASIENVMYVVQNGFINAITRAILSVPGHMFFAVLMGYYISLWHMHKKAAAEEKKLCDMGLISIVSPIKYKHFVFLSILMPVLAHGFYDFCCSVPSVFSILLVLAFVIFLYIYCFIKIAKVSKRDVNDISFSQYIVLKKYPQLVAYYSSEESVEEPQTVETEASVKKVASGN